MVFFQRLDERENGWIRFGMAGNFLVLRKYREGVGPANANGHLSLAPAGKNLAPVFPVQRNHVI